MKPDPTLEELQQQLRDLGIPEGWSSTQQGATTLPIIERQKEVLTKVQKLLLEQIKKDTSRVAELHAILQRSKHGGGG
jgi:hypothetical protein